VEQRKADRLELQRQNEDRRKNPKQGWSRSRGSRWYRSGHQDISELATWRNCWSSGWNVARKEYGYLLRHR